MPLNKKEIGQVLKKEEIVYIATTKPNGDPHVVPIWFVIWKGKIWFETDNTTQKWKNIQKRNKVCLCFGGKNTYIVWGRVKWYTEKEAPLPFRKMLWEKYGKDMDDSYINENTFIFEVIPEREISWHYAPEWD